MVISQKHIRWRAKRVPLHAVTQTHQHSYFTEMSFSSLPYLIRCTDRYLSLQELPEQIRAVSIQCPCDLLLKLTLRTQRSGRGQSVYLKPDSAPTRHTGEGMGGEPLRNKPGHLQVYAIDLGSWKSHMYVYKGRLPNLQRKKTCKPHDLMLSRKTALEG